VSTWNSKELLRQFQQGDSQAANEIFDRYVTRLVALVRSRISAKLRPRLDPEDVVQSAYRSFFIHAKDDEFQLSDAGDLWRLLARITLNKLYGQVEFHTAARRTVVQEVAAASHAEPIAIEPTPAEVVAIGENLQRVYDDLGPIQREVLTAHLRGNGVNSIASTTNRSPRTVRRILTDVRTKIERQLSLSTNPRQDFVGIGPTSVADSLAPLPYNDFVLERLVGAGGMGKVYRALQQSTGAYVAIKALLKSRQMELRAVEKFLQEGQILSTLHHPNIVGFKGIGRFPGGGFFLAMAFVDGKDLQSQITTVPLNSVRAAHVVRDVAVAIAHAHSKNIVHGDLKPANVILDQTGQVVVTDFGLAQFVAQKDKPNRPTWLVGGTVGYIAPEVLASGTSPTIAADIYGLGALLFALSTGRPPQRPFSLSTDDEVTAEISQICARCLEIDPSARHRSANQLVEQLNRLLNAT
jgi:eukaryotic-like serine/threonine-protein kinase